jgi:hypothetical protein
MDKGAAIREKAMLICDLLTSPQRLEEERQISRMYREKMGLGSVNHYGGGA